MPTGEKYQAPSWDEVYAPIQEKIDAQNEKANRDKGLHNLLSDDDWFIVSGTTEDAKLYRRSVDFTTVAPDAGFTKENYLYFKYLTLLMMGGYANKHNEIICSGATPITVMKSIIRFIAECTKPIAMNLWEEIDYKEFFQWRIREDFEGGQGRAFDTLISWLVYLNKLEEKREFPYRMTARSFKKVIKPVVLEYLNTDEYADWINGQSYASIPLEVSMVMLGYVLMVLESDEVKFLEAFYQEARNVEQTFCNVALEKFLKKLVISENGIDIKSTHTNTRVYVTKNYDLKKQFLNRVTERYCKSTSGGLESLKRALESIVSFSSKKTYLGSISDYAHHAFDCIYVYLVAITGFRYHEIRNMLAKDCLRNDIEGRCYLKTTIDKTPVGTIERMVHPYTNRVVEIANNITLAKKDKDYEHYKVTFENFKLKRKGAEDAGHEFSGIPILLAENVMFTSAYFYKDFWGSHYSKANGFDQTTATQMIKNVWKSASEEIHPELKKRLEEKIEKNLTSHGFRHAWAEFALLNFADGANGGVLAGIAKEFGYTKKNITDWIQNYSSNKTNPVHQRAVEFQVAKTLVNRLFGEVIQKAHENPNDESKWLPEHFKGDMATKIALYLKASVEDIVLADPGDLYDLAEEYLNDRLIRIEANPWGYCILMKDNTKSAACNDSKYDIQKEESGAFHLCIKCPNHLIFLPVNKAFLIQTRLSHQSILDYYNQSSENIIDFNTPEKRQALIRTSQSIVDAINRQFKE
ncbi:MAG: hypothetical protein AB7C96_05505 [Hydrogenovibrio sp.]